MNDDQLINKQYHILQRSKKLDNDDKYIYDKVGNLINNSLETINFDIKKCLELGYSTNIVNKYIVSRFKNVDYSIAEISSNLLKQNINNINIFQFDHDKWNIKKDDLDLIISNFYLHLTSNIDLLFKNIHNSLQNNGFFIATMPSNNSFYELKNSMIQADTEIYNGVYRRFMKCYSVENLNLLLKKYNYKMPVIEIDNIKILYNKFSSLLRDVRNLRNTSIYKDRKSNFEKKTYFKKVEDIYWNKFSNNNKLILQLEIIMITAWKQD